MTKTEPQKVYELTLFRRDGAHINITQDTNFEEINSLWIELTERWASAIKEQRPFILNRPVVTSFDPGLIYEITVRPLVETSRANLNNPYYQDMLEKGLGQSLQRQPGNILDGGYKY